jgi:hypothetical protein
MYIASAHRLLLLRSSTIAMEAISIETSILNYLLHLIIILEHPSYKDRAASSSILSGLN